MAIYMVICNNQGKFKDDNSVKCLIDYITDPEAIAPGYIYGGAVSNDPETAIIEMQQIQRDFGKESGVRMRHSVLAFSPREAITYRQVGVIAREAIRYYSPKYQILAAVHDNRQHAHIHFAMNTVSYLDGRKYPGTKQDLYGFVKFLNQIVRPLGLFVNFQNKAAYHSKEECFDT